MVLRRDFVSQLLASAGGLLGLSSDTSPPHEATNEVGAAAVPEPALNVRAFGAAGDGETDDTQAIRAALATSGGRVPLVFPTGNYRVTAPLELLSGQLLQGAGKWTNAALIYVGEGSLFRKPASAGGSGYWILRDLRLNGQGRGAEQIAVDLLNVNYSQLQNVGIFGFGTGIRLSSGNGGVECHYNELLSVYLSECGLGIDVGAGAHSNGVLGGRLWNCPLGVRINHDLAPANHVWFKGTAFECGIGATAIESRGTNVNFSACRFETRGINVRILRGAGVHWFFGNHWSSGVDIEDQNSRPVGMGVDAPYDYELRTN